MVKCRVVCFCCVGALIIIEGMTDIMKYIWPVLRALCSVLAVSFITHNFFYLFDFWLLNNVTAFVWSVYVSKPIELYVVS